MRRASSITGSPNLALFAESDLWPNLILACTGARHSADPGQRPAVGALVHALALSAAHHRRAAVALRSLPAQSEPDAERYRELGAPRVSITGNLKLDVPAPPADAGKLAAIRAVVRQRPVIAAASTHPGEEAVIIDAHRRLRQSFPGLLTIIAPRHPERGSGVVEIATAAGLNAVARSRGLLPDRGTDIYVADTIGELGLIYRLAPIVFMGGSLVRHGGQNPIEAAKLGAAILHGPHVWNFAEIYAALDEARGAEEVLDVNRLAVRIGAWLTDAAARKQVADAGACDRRSARRRAAPHARGARALSDAARSRAALNMRAPRFWWEKPGAHGGAACRHLRRSMAPSRRGG